ncbi:MAG: phospholipase D-like domain-containing protein, partial [Candidatus Marinimicrobia bacterium]|nr:phospholipase D-like domain-containing protein [Candidatus Neomarinimicrobiota bacterium]
MSTKFFTNFGQNTLFKKFEGIFAYNKDIQFFDALVGFFRSSGYFAIRPFLEDVPHIRILIGINVDKIISKYHAKGLLFQTDTQQAKKEFIQDIKADIQNSEYTKNVEKGIVQFIEDVISKKIEIKAHPTRNLHAKIYIFRPENFSEHQPGSIITGSSNLTGAGIGSSNESNYEFNVILHDYDDIKFASDEFQMLWDEGVPILPQEIQNVEKDTFIKAEPTPFELYIKFLIEYFGKSVEFDPNSITDLPKGFYRLSYQIDSVNQGFDLLQKHNGFFLADVVGLGKTVVTTLIAKIFFYSNDYPSHITKTLVIFPPGLKDNWLNTFDQFGLQNYDWITNGSIHRVKNPERYDLIIVDEAHKFRNDTAEAYTALQLLCKTPTSHILPDGTKAMKKVVLVSATPLNNRPADIRNQLLLFQDAKDSTLDISNLQSYFARKIEDYKRAARESDTGKMQSMIAVIYADIRDKIIEPITIRRTRADLLDHEQYRKDLEEQGIRFPNVEKPRKIYYQLDAVLEALYDHTIKKISNPSKGLQYYRYRAIEFLIPSIKQKYKNADLLSSQLANIMKTLLVKRIDSSFCAFKISLKRFFKASKAMVKMFNDNKIYITPNLNVTDYILDDNEEELIHQIENARETDPTITVCNPEDFLPAFIEGLKRDHD